MPPADLNQILIDILQELKPSIDREHAVVSVGHLPTLSVNRAQIGDVFRHLIGNALKFRTTLYPHVRVSAAHNVHDWILAVQDNGAGVDPKQWNVIFQNPGGGLSVCKKIVESHGGRIWGHSGPGAGAAFYFSLPDR